MSSLKIAVNLAMLTTTLAIPIFFEQAYNVPSTWGSQSRDEAKQTYLQVQHQPRIREVAQLNTQPVRLSGFFRDFISLLQSNPMDESKYGHTRDVKEQHEKQADDDKVEGYYVMDPIPIARYDVDKHREFQTHVQKSGHCTDHEPKHLIIPAAIYDNSIH